MSKNRKSGYYHLRMTPALREAFENMATLEGVSPPTVVRELLTGFVNGTIDIHETIRTNARTQQ